MDFDFVMCNPPFYSSAEDVSRSSEFKELDPNAVRNLAYAYVTESDQLAQICTGAEVEMITPGGETSFIARIFSESLELRTKCR
jgi:23S rRNA A1618 N6-methylase RlmF